MLILGMGALGALLGLLIAWSSSPVVATTLPLLFGIVGGASGFSLLKMDFAKPGSQQKLKAAGAALLSCCLACIATVVIGIATKGMFLALQNDSLVYQLSSEELSHRVTAIDELLLRKRLSSIGAAKSEIQALMGGSPKSADFKVATDQISAVATDLLTAYDELSENERRQADGQMGSSKFAELCGATRIFSMLKGNADKNGTISAGRFQLSTSALYSIDFASIIPNDSDSKAFSDHPKLVAAIANLQSALERNNTLSNAFTQTKKIDEFIKLIAAAKQNSDIPLIASNPLQKDDIM
jgi:hypothetical protein